MWLCIKPGLASERFPWASRRARTNAEPILAALLLGCLHPLGGMAESIVVYGDSVIVATSSDTELLPEAGMQLSLVNDRLHLDLLPGSNQGGEVGIQFYLVGTDTVALIPTTISGDAPVILNGSLPSGNAGESYSVGLSAVGGVVPYTWSLAPQSAPLPPGLSLSAAGQISGTPTLGGTYAFTVQVSDTQLLSSVAALSITVVVPNQPPSAPTGVLATAGDRKVTLSWFASTDPDGDLVGYDVLRRTGGTSYGAAIARVLQPGYTDPGLQNDTTYYYTIRSVDAAGLTAHSAEISAVPNSRASDAYVVQDPILQRGVLGGAGYLATRAADGQVQTLTETRQGQNVALEAEYLLRTTADPTQVETFTLHLVAAFDPASDLFHTAIWNVLAASWDDISSSMQAGEFTPVSDPRHYIGLNGEIRVRFTDRVRGNRTEPADTMSVDLLYARIRTIASVAQPPVAQNLSVTTTEETAVNVGLVASDPAGAPLTFELVTIPVHGTLTGTAPYLVYTPVMGYVGADAFSYRASNGSLYSNLATVSIGIEPQVELRISMMSTETETVLSWASVPGAIYQLLYKETLSAPAWTALSDPIVATGSTTSYADPIDSQASRTRFYLVEQALE